MKPLIILIGGMDRAGKDTVGSYLADYFEDKEYLGYTVAFADELKYQAVSVFDITNFDAYKEKTLGNLLRRIFKPMFKLFGFIPADRDFIIKLSTAVKRKDIDFYAKSVDFSNGVTIVTDLRFKHELDYVNETYGETHNIVKLLVEDRRMYNGEIPKDAFDYTILNTGTLGELYRECFDFVICNEVLLKYITDIRNSGKDK